MFAALANMSYDVIARRDSFVAYDRTQAGVEPSWAVFDLDLDPLTVDQATAILVRAGVDCDVFFEELESL